MNEKDEIHDYLENIISLNPDVDLEKPAWGEINFNVAADVVGEIIELCEMLNGLPIHHLPKNTFTTLASVLREVVNVFNQIRGFSIQDSPMSRRNEIVNRLKDLREQLLGVCQGAIPFLALFKGGLNNLVANITNAYEGSSEWVETSREEMKKKLEEMQKITKDFAEVLETARQRASKEGVADFAVAFKLQKEANDAEAVKWLIASAVFAIVTVLVPLLFLLYVPLPTDNPTLVQYVSTKLVILGIFVGATTWCAGNYRAARHLSTVNAHKANSLSSFITFVRSTEDHTTRDQVLLETTRSIFAQPPTGFLKGETPADKPSRMIEVIKAATGDG